ncbi:hypothetical protein [Nocardia mexicana]|uniref:DUF8176 domain-containing protein n=1 Tax=Nocardia mexicana TaxID=279262 RepID=A0A370HAW1_9NOCA|nr:hypothetical protein [Nocardia mexicana]RDI53194.1 hypothetical protein DFR68_103582 [Nocardia mexicana]
MRARGLSRGKGEKLVGSDSGRSDMPVRADSGLPPNSGFGPPLGPPDWLTRDVPPAQPNTAWQPLSPAEPGLALDPDMVQRALGSPARKARGAKRGPRRMLVLLALVLVAAVAALGAFLVSVTGGTAGAPVPVAAAPVPAPAGQACEAERRDSLTSGNGPGDTVSGAGAILGFEHAYYTQRNGRAAQTFVAPDTVNVASAELLQQAIDAEIPVGTTHCVRIVERLPEWFDVDIEEHRPTGAVAVYKQSMRTVVRDGHTVIYEIRDR